MEGVQKQLCENPLSGYLHQFEESLNLEFSEILQQDEFCWMIRSNSNWILEGDRNTSFFYKTTLTRRKRNKILQLKNEVGESITDHNEIQSHICSFYQKLFQIERMDTPWPQQLICPITPESPFISVCSPPSFEEVRRSIFRVGAFKASGPDGFHAFFYHKNWHLIKDDVFAFISSIFHSASIPPFINKTNAVLIPKCMNPKNIKKFRPVSLCNTLYKVITKIIVERMKHILPVLISLNQNAFLANRGPDTNMIVATEIVHSIANRKGKRGWLAFKIDLEKAFDKMEWDFIQAQHWGGATGATA